MNGVDIVWNRETVRSFLERAEYSQAGSIERLTALGQLAEEVDEAILEEVERLRGSGHSWDVIGKRLGLSPSATQQRYLTKLGPVPQHQSENKP